MYVNILHWKISYLDKTFALTSLCEWIKVKPCSYCGRHGYFCTSRLWPLWSIKGWKLSSTCLWFNPQDYMNNIHSKEILLMNTTVKVPGRRPQVVRNNPGGSPSKSAPGSNGISNNMRAMTISGHTGIVEFKMGGITKGHFRSSGFGIEKKNRHMVFLDNLCFQLVGFPFVLKKTPKEDQINTWRKALALQQCRAQICGENPHNVSHILILG